MRAIKMALLLVMSVFIMGTVLSASDKAPAQSIGENLVRKFWADLKNGDISTVEKLLADGFQAVNRFGARDIAAQRKVLRDLNLGEYRISNVKATQNGPVIVVTYLVAAQETLLGKRLPPGKPSPRMSVFVKTDSRWQWIAHANLRWLK